MEVPVSSEVAVPGGLDSSLVAAMRLVLASSVLFIIAPVDLDELAAFQIACGLYTLYSVFPFVERAKWTWLSGVLVCADLGWAAGLTALSSDAGIAFLFLFPTLIASFQWSFIPAWRLTLVAAMLLVIISFYKAQLEAELFLHEILLPPMYLMVFGYLVASWGNRELTSKRRLMLLRDITRLSNPRFGTDRMIGTMMERLRHFYAAEACLMIVTNPTSDEHLLRCVDRRDPERAIRAESIPIAMAKRLLAPSLEQAIIYPGTPALWQRWRSVTLDYVVFDIRKGRRITASAEIDQALIAIVDAESFISIPLYYPDNSIGRLYLTSMRRRAFSPDDVSFLLHVIEQIVPVIENIRMVDQLATNAAEEERRRLARDIHDNVIQPYIGFQIGLAAVNQKLHMSASDTASDIAKLMAITEQGIDSLRNYVYRLPSAGKREGVLLAALQRFATTFTETTHITVQVEAAYDVYITDRLAAEVFQMVVEGLSNIRWHTHAEHASINIARQNDNLIVRIVNDCADEAVPLHFRPWSITERAAALGGQVHVEHIAGNNTLVMIEIPL